MVLEVKEESGGKVIFYKVLAIKATYIISWDDISRIAHRDGCTRRFLLFFNRFGEATRFLENAKHIFDVAWILLALEKATFSFAQER